MVNMTIDIEKFNALKARSSAIFPLLMERYLLDSELYLETIQENIKTGNHENITAAAHNLKSSSGLLGFSSLFETAQKLEYAAKSKEMREKEAQNLESLFQTLQHHVIQAQNFVEKEQKQPFS